jgi:cellulose synthase (UDP-forming)
MQSLFSLAAIIRVFHNPRAPKFVVTPKGERLNGDFISSLAAPFYVLIAITAGCLVAAAIRITYYPDEMDVAMITGTWSLFNLILLIGALGALFERRQRRITPRVHIPVELSGAVHVNGRIIACRVFDISVTGAGFVTDTPLEPMPEEESEIDLVLENPGLGQLNRIPCVVRRVFECKPQSSLFNRLIGRSGQPAAARLHDYEIGLEFRPATISDQRAIVALVYGDYKVLSRNWVRRQRHRGVVSAMRFLLAHGLYHSFMHLAHLLMRFWHAIRHQYQGRKPGKALVSAKFIRFNQLRMKFMRARWRQYRGRDYRDSAVTLRT